jgi:putative PIN family toxin of toxin-antitoxin system
VTVLIKVVLDTNILISAIVFGGKPRQVLESAIKGHFQLVHTEKSIEEMRAVLEGKKFQFPSEIMDLIVHELEALAEIIKPKERLAVIKKDPEDNRVLECAVESQADYIVTGDFHLLEIKEFQGTKIMTPGEFLEILDK